MFALIFILRLSALIFLFEYKIILSGDEAVAKIIIKPSANLFHKLLSKKRFSISENWIYLFASKIIKYCLLQITNKKLFHYKK